jgi:hypothetical protein
VLTARLAAELEAGVSSQSGKAANHQHRCPRLGDELPYRQDTGYYLHNSGTDSTLSVFVRPRSRVAVRKRSSPAWAWTPACSAGIEHVRESSLDVDVRYSEAGLSQQPYTM